MAFLYNEETFVIDECQKGQLVLYRHIVCRCLNEGVNLTPIARNATRLEVMKVPIDDLMDALKNVYTSPPEGYVASILDAALSYPEATKK